MNTTPIDQLEDLADGVPVLAVEGTIKYAGPVTHSKPDAPHPWTKQFFVLGSDTADIGCSMWDAEGSEMTKGEKVHIENTQNKKGQWSGMTKGSYQKNGERKHTLEIRAHQVKIKMLNGEPIQRDTIPESEQRDDAERMFPTIPNNATNGGVTEARKHIMQSANLYVLCVNAVNKYVAEHLPEVAQTSEMFQAATGTLFIEASRAGFVNKMPQTPLP